MASGEWESADETFRIVISENGTWEANSKGVYDKQWKKDASGYWEVLEQECGVLGRKSFVIEFGCELDVKLGSGIIIHGITGGQIVQRDALLLRNVLIPDYLDRSTFGKIFLNRTK